MNTLHKRGPSTKLVWTETEQKQAMLMGIFVARVTTLTAQGPVHRAKILDRINKNKSAKPLIAIIAKRAFRCEPFFEKLEAFLRQQATFGWSGAWENRCYGEVAMLQRMRDKRQSVIARRLADKPPTQKLPARRPSKTVVFDQ